MDINKKLSPHFSLCEFLHNKNPEGLTESILANLTALSQKLEAVRAALGDKPIKITSGYRTPEYNRAIGGVKGSQHCFGNAADITVEGLTPQQVQKKLKDWVGGMGCYSTFTHLDIRNYKARWKG